MRVKLNLDEQVVEPVTFQLLHSKSYIRLEESMLQIYTDSSVNLEVSLESALGSSSRDLGLEQHL